MVGKKDIEVGLHDITGALLMLNKKERILMKELLALTLSSESAKDWIAKRLGAEYIKVGQKLLKSMGGA